jgi:hypothetical protein
VLRASNANFPMIWMFRGKGKRLTYIVISVTMVCCSLMLIIVLVFITFSFSNFWFLLLCCQKQWRTGIKRHWRKWWSRRKTSIVIRTNQLTLYVYLDLLELYYTVYLIFSIFLFDGSLWGFFCLIVVCIIQILFLFLLMQFEIISVCVLCTLFRYVNTFWMR